MSTRVRWTILILAQLILLGVVGLASAAPALTAISGTVTLQARSSSAGVIILYDDVAVATTNAAGEFTVNVATGGPHILTARATGYVPRRLFLDDPHGALTLPSTALLLGDANGDDRVDLSDAILVSSSFNTNPPTDSRADLNRDGRVDLTDMVAVASNYGLKGPLPWTDGSALVWSSRPNLGTPRHHHGVVENGGLIYAVGGCCEAITAQLSPLANVEAYNPLSGVWSPRAPLTAPRTNLGVAAVNGLIYAIGGLGPAGKPLSTVEEYDPKTDTWKMKQDMPTPRSGLAVTAIDGKIYALGGQGDTDLATVEVYDPKTDTWASVASMPTARVNLAAASTGGKLYALGGWGGGGHLATVEVYDPATDTWQGGPNLLTPRSELAAVTNNGKVYVLGGYSDGTPTMPLNTVESLDPADRQWTSETGMTTARLGLGAAALNGKLLAIGGYGLGALGTVEEAAQVSAQQKASSREALPANFPFQMLPKAMQPKP